MTDTIRPEFAKVMKDSAEAAKASLPERLERLMVLAKNSDTPIYVSPEIAEHMSQNVEAVAKYVKYATEQLQSLNAGGYVSRFAAVAGKPVRLLVVDDAPRGVFTEKFTQDMRATYFLDHELGHYLVKSGSGGGHLGECSADAFGALRHIQRYGMQDEFFQYTNKSTVVVLGASTIHYTSAVMARAQEIAKERDIMGLSLAETATLANEIANAVALDAQKIEKLTKAFAGATAVYRKEIGSKQDVGAKLFAGDKDAYALFVRETLKVVAATDDPDILKAANEFFAFPPMRKFLDENPQTGTSRPEKNTGGMKP